MTTTSALDFKLGDLTISSKGAKAIPVTTRTGSPLIWMHNESLIPCYQPSAFNDPDATRVNLCLQMTDSLAEQLKSLDRSLITALSADSKKYFGQNLSADEVKNRMQPSVKVSEKGFDHWRCKLNLSGRGKVQCYSMDKTVRALPENWLAVSVRPRVQIKSIWIMSKEIGVIYEVVACQIDESVQECPF
jgi:hypothetical protein